MSARVSPSLKDLLQDYRDQRGDANRELQPLLDHLEDAWETNALHERTIDDLLLFATDELSSPVGRWFSTPIIRLALLAPNKPSTRKRLGKFLDVCRLTSLVAAVYWLVRGVDCEHLRPSRSTRECWTHLIRLLHGVAAAPPDFFTPTDCSRLRRWLRVVFWRDDNRPAVSHLTSTLAGNVASLRCELGLSPNYLAELATSFRSAAEVLVRVLESESSSDVDPVWSREVREAVFAQCVGRRPSLVMSSWVREIPLERVRELVVSGVSGEETRREVMAAVLQDRGWLTWPSQLAFQEAAAEARPKEPYFIVLARSFQALPLMGYFPLMSKDELLRLVPWLSLAQTTPSGLVLLYCRAWPEAPALSAGEMITELFEDEIDIDFAAFRYPTASSPTLLNLDDFRRRCAISRLLTQITAAASQLSGQLSRQPRRQRVGGWT